jgi:hypothetical protein
MAGSLHDLIEVVGTVETFDKEVVSGEDALPTLRHREEDIGEDGSIWVTTNVDGESVEWGEVWRSRDTETEGVLCCLGGAYCGLVGHLPSLQVVLAEALTV